MTGQWETTKERVSLYWHLYSLPAVWISPDAFGIKSLWDVCNSHPHLCVYSSVCVCVTRHPGASRSLLWPWSPSPVCSDHTHRHTIAVTLSWSWNPIAVASHTKLASTARLCFSFFLNVGGCMCLIRTTYCLLWDERRLSTTMLKDLTRTHWPWTESCKELKWCLSFFPKKPSSWVKQ